MVSYEHCCGRSLYRPDALAIAHLRHQNIRGVTSYYMHAVLMVIFQLNLGWHFSIITEILTEHRQVANSEDTNVLQRGDG